MYGPDYMLQEEQSSFTTPAGNLPTNLSHLCTLSQRFSGDITTLTIQYRAADLQGQLKLGCCLNNRLGPAIGSRILALTREANLALTREANLFWCSICILGSLSCLGIGVLCVNHSVHLLLSA